MAENEKHWAAKLTDAQIEQIRERHRLFQDARQWHSVPALAKEFGVHPNYLNKIIRGEHRKPSWLR